MEEKEFSLSGSPAVYSETESPPAIRLAVVDGGGSVPQETNTTFNASTGIAAPASSAATGGGGGGSGGVLGKKKRGRPRKYDSDGNLRVPNKSPPPPGFFLSPPPPSDFSAKRGRGRGRPAGSGKTSSIELKPQPRTSSSHHTTPVKMGLEETRAALRSKYPELTPDDFKAAAGNRDALAKIVAEKKGISEEDAKKEVNEIFDANA